MMSHSTETRHASKWEAGQATHAEVISEGSLKVLLQRPVDFIAAKRRSDER